MSRRGSVTNTMIRRQSSFGRDVDHAANTQPVNGSTRTLPRIPTSGCEVPFNMQSINYPPHPATLDMPVRCPGKPPLAPVCPGPILSPRPSLPPCSSQPTFSSCSAPVTSAVVCNDARCQLGINTQPDTAFNSSCQQCLEERAAQGGGSVSSSKTAQESTYSIDHDDSQRSNEFSPIPDDETDVVMPSLAPSMISTKSLVNDELETRGGRIVNAKPGRTYECESLCRKGSMLFFSTIGVTVVAAGYAMLGAFLFSAIESRAVSSGGLQTADLVTEAGQTSPTVMNSTMMLADLPTEVKTYIDEIRHRTVAKLWDMTEKMNILYPKNWTKEAAEEIMHFQDLLSRKLAVEILSRPKPQSKPIAAHPTATNNKEWTFTRGLLYSLTLLTTIGSGCDGVTSSLARVVSVVYIILGVPIMILYLSTIGSLAAKTVRCVCCSIMTRSPGQKLGQKNNRSDSTNTFSGSVTSVEENGGGGGGGRCEKIVMTPLTPDESIRGVEPTWTVVPSNRDSSSQLPSSSGTVSVARPNVAGPIFFCIFLMTSYILCSAVVMAKIQGWTYFQSFYFCFMSLTTIGFGGLRPSQPNLTVCILFILIGVILAATCLHILLEEVVFKLRQFKVSRLAMRRAGGDPEGLGRQFVNGGERVS